MAKPLKQVHKQEDFGTNKSCEGRYIIKKTADRFILEKTA